VLRRIDEGVPEAQKKARARLNNEGWAEKTRLFEEWTCAADESGRTADSGNRERGEALYV
jgi:hypothetical protein